MTLDVQYAPQLEVEGGTEAEEGADLVVRQQCNNIDGSAFQNSSTFQICLDPFLLKG